MNSEPTVNSSRHGSPDKLALDDLKNLDWNRLWKAKLASRPSLRRNASFWDGRAPAFAKSTETAYSDQLLDLMKPEAHWTVLDMGCGSGTLAVPLAGKVASVTAVDFSQEMLAVVRKRCAEEGISNVKTIHGSWEEDWEKLGIGAYDTAIASRSLVVDDLQASILKLNAVARKRVYIVTVTGDGPRDRRVFDAIGKPCEPGADYIYCYNLLYQVGIRANVAFIEEIRNRTYESPEEAALSMQWMFGDLTDSEKEKIADYVREHLIPSSGAWRFSYSQIIRWAVMWWKKE